MVGQKQRKGQVQLQLEAMKKKKKKQGVGGCSFWKRTVVIMDGSGGVKYKRLLHLHLAVESRAVLVQHMPETNENKSFHRPHI